VTGNQGHSLFRPRLTLTAAVCGAAMMLAGCAQMPSSGDVEEGVGELSAPRGGHLLPEAPEPGDSQLEIVQGFLRTVGAGPEDDYSVARQFLTHQARKDWIPTERTLVHPVDWSFDPVVHDDDSVEFEVPVSATVDNHGRYAPASEGTEEDISFSLEKNRAGEWRIAKLPDGVMISVTNFDLVYSQIPVYFATADQERLVPELRWFPRADTATWATQAILDGPSPWLRDAVHDAVPAGTALGADEVIVQQGTASVDLTREILDASTEDRGMLATALEETLARLPNIQDVDLHAGDVEIERADERPALERESTPVSPLMAFSDVPEEDDDSTHESFVEYVEGEFVPREDLEIPEEEVTTFATPLDTQDPIAVATKDRVLGVEPDSESVVLFDERGVNSVSWDRHGWLWASREGSAKLSALTYDGDYVELTPEWLKGREVLQVQVSREGARIMVLSRADKGVDVDVAGLVRDEDGVPQGISSSIAISTTFDNVKDAVWVDELLVAFLAEGSSGGSNAPYFVEIGGENTPLPVVKDAQNLAAGKGERNLYLTTSDERLYVRDGKNWSPVAENIHYPQFPG